MQSLFVLLVLLVLRLHHDCTSSDKQSEVCHAGAVFWLAAGCALFRPFLYMLAGSKPKEEMDIAKEEFAELHFLETCTLRSLSCMAIHDA